MISDWCLPRLGGTETHLHDLALRLARAGHDAQIITSTPGADATDGVRTHRLDAPLFPGIGLVWTRRAFAQIKSILQNEACDVVHCHGNVVNPVAYGGLYISQKLGIPAIITWKSILGVYTPLMKMMDRLYHWSEWPVVFSAVSAVAAKDIISIVGEKPVHILPNGIDTSAWQAGPAARDAKEILLVSVMRLARKKRPLALIKMVPEILAQIPGGLRLKVKIIGDGEKRNAMEKLIAKLSLQNVVELTGRLSRPAIREIFSKTDISICASKWESFGIAVLEARCAGLPVVALESGGVKEIIQNGRGGLLAKTDREMSGQIVRLILDWRLRADMAQHNRENPPPMNWENVLAEHMRLYQLAIAMRRQAPQSATRQDSSGKGSTRSGKG